MTRVFEIKVKKLVRDSMEEIWECEIKEKDKVVIHFFHEKGLVVEKKLNKSYQVSALGVMRLTNYLRNENYQGIANTWVDQAEVVDNHFKDWETNKLKRSIQEWSMVSPPMIRWVYLGKAFLIAREFNIELRINHTKELETDNIKKPIVELIKLRKNEVYNVDVFDFLKVLPNESIDLAIVDPPYYLIDAEWDKKQFKSDYDFMDFTKRWIDELVPKLKKTGSLYIFNTPQNCALIYAYVKDRTFGKDTMGERFKLHFRNWITWYKKDGLSVAKKQFCNNQETILFYTRSKEYTFNHDEVRMPYTAPERVNSPKGILKDGKRWFPHPNGKLCPDVWEISSDRHKKKVDGRIIKNEHPTPKPEDMIERMIKASSNEGELVLDLFSGTGTTSLVAERLKRKWVAVEKNERFVSVIRERLKNEQIKIKEIETNKNINL